MRCAHELPECFIKLQGKEAVESLFQCHRSWICQRIKIGSLDDELEVEIRVWWNEKDRMLKLSIPTAEQQPRFLGQVAYGVQELPMNGDEAVAQKWVAVVGPQTALTCVNDGSYGCDFSEDGLRLSLLRSPAYTAHPILDRPLVRQDRFEPRIDQGERMFRFWINAGEAKERMKSIDREALAKNEKPFGMQMFPERVERVGGVEGVEGAGLRPFVVLKGEAVQMTAMKLAEDGEDIIIRLFEPTGQKRSVVLSLPLFGIDKKVTMSPFEIKTLRVDVGKRKVVETDLMEKV